MKKTFFLLLFLCTVAFLSAQGTITGTLIDGESGEPIMFANVYIDGTTNGSETDFDGKFQLKADAGTYTVVASYVGYPDKKIEGVVVNDKEVTYLDFTMKEDAVALEEVVVKAERIERTEAALLVARRKADKIEDAISSEEMSRFSVGSAAGAMKKITGATVQGGKYIFIRGLGDRYSLSQLNGLIMPSSDPYRNGAQLDLIPSNLLENIVTAKTFTPDQPGTFTGGAVNIKTKSIPEQFSLTFSASTSFNSQSNMIDNFLTHEGGSNDKFGFGSSARPLPQFIVDASEDPSQRIYFNRNAAVIAMFPPNPLYNTDKLAELQTKAANELSTQFAPTEIASPLNHSFGLTFGNRFDIGGNPLGVILSGSFSRKFQHLPGFKRANWRLENVEIENQGDLAVTQSTETPTLNGLAGLAYKFGSGQEVNFTAIYNQTADKVSRFAEGERPQNIIAPDFYQGRSLVFNERQLNAYQLGGSHVFKAANNLKFDWKVGRTDSYMREPDTRTFENQYSSEFNNYSIPESNIQRPFHFFRDLKDGQWDYKADFTLPLGDTDNKIKFGGYITQKEREFKEYRFQVEENTGNSAQFTGSVLDYMATDNIGVIGRTDQGGYILGNFITNVSEDRNRYTGNANVSAAYAMGTFNPTDKFKIIVGARYEKTDYKVVSADTSSTDGIIDVNDILPSVSLVYKMSDKMNLRAVYSRTVARPNMREIAPFESFDPILLLTYFGNPDLKRTNIDNMDLRWELFPNSGEVLALSAYYKHFTNPIAIGFRDKLGREVQYGNPETADLYGVELEVRKNLNFISPALDNWKFSGNFSYIYSRMDPLNFTDVIYERVRPFTGQPEYIINASLIYENKDIDFDGVLSLNTLGDQLMLIGLEETPDTYLRGRSQLDLTLRKKIGGLTVKFNAQNLLNSAYLQSLKLEENDDKEKYIFSKYQTGTTFGLGISYTIK